MDRDPVVAEEDMRIQNILLPRKAKADSMRPRVRADRFAPSLARLTHRAVRLLTS